jgi:hypothetical protein
MNGLFPIPELALGTSGNENKKDWGPPQQSKTLWRAVPLIWRKKRVRPKVA